MSCQVARIVITVVLMVGTRGRALDLPMAQVASSVISKVSSEQISENEAYYNRKNRFIQAPGSREVWYQDAKTESVHLIRFSCNACGEPSPCSNPVPVSKEYIARKPMREDFSCRMFREGIETTWRPIVTTTRTSTRAPPSTSPPSTSPREISLGSTTTTTTTTEVAAGGSSSGGWLFLLLLLLCCCCCLAAAAAWFVWNHCHHEEEDSEEEEPETREFHVPPAPPPQPFVPVAPPQPEMELVTITPGGYSVVPLNPGQEVPSGVPVIDPRVESYRQLPQQPSQEMELVTVTPTGYSVSPLAAGQAVPAGVPVFTDLMG